MKIIDYCIVSAGECEVLEHNVTNMIPQGWQPLGAPTYHSGGEHQAMVVYEEHEPNWEKTNEV